jgi:hypothetical protein
MSHPEYDLFLVIRKRKARMVAVYLLLFSIAHHNSDI